jgi:hypothetical protein
MGIFLVNKHIKTVYFFSSFFMLFFGLIIYLFFRKNDWGFVFYSINYISSLFNFGNISPFIIYNLPDGLWFLSGILLIRSICFFEKHICYFYTILFLFIAIILEIFQLNNSVIGTFDIIDISIIIIFSIIESLIYNIFWRKLCIKINI